MIMLKREPAKDRLAWQEAFVLLLPEIERLLWCIFRDRDPEGRIEAVQSGTVLCLLAFERLARRRRDGAVTASTLVWYAVLQIRRDRPAGVRMNSKEPLSSYAQRRRGFKLERLQSWDSSQGSWIDSLVVDWRAPVADVVATRLDFREWLGTLCWRVRRIATDLAKGFTTSEAACKYHVSRGRISQIRRELEKSWRAYQHEDVVAPASL